MEKTIALIPGDGIGPDVVAEAVNVLDAVAKKFGHKWTYKNVIAGGGAIDKFGHPLPQEQLDIALSSDAALLGAVGGPKWDDVAPGIRPEKALLGLRGGMKVFANLRPAVMWKQLKDACPLKDEIAGDGSEQSVRSASVHHERPRIGARPGGVVLPAPLREERPLAALDKADVAGDDHVGVCGDDAAWDVYAAFRNRVAGIRYRDIGTGTCAEVPGSVVLDEHVPLPVIHSDRAVGGAKRRNDVALEDTVFVIDLETVDLAGRNV